MTELIFKGTPQLKTDRLILRKITPADAGDIFEYASDEEVSRYVIWDTHKTIEDSREFIRLTLERYERDEAGDWGIVWRENGKLIGTAGFGWHDMNNRRAEIGYVLARPYWGQGIMPEAARRIVQFGFEEMGLNRVECCHFLPNEKSGRVMQKVGMSFEGIARERILAKDRFWDIKQYAILRSDRSIEL
ncbi:MAG TPA: GNAT family N-acetyltransferase [Firmicutes bacterium]|jgi:[ribosomal protein S5]-alanine N-acetyltransferase|nr:GNAT family N-acetyltransferase [Bacillota bacterium]